MRATSLAPAIAAALLVSPALARQVGVVHSGGGASPSSGVSGGGSFHSASPPVIMKMREVPVPSPHPVEDGSVLRGEPRRPGMPDRDERGGPIQVSPPSTPPTGHVSIVRNPQIVPEVRHLEGAERRHDFFFWHDVGGVRFCHYYDDFGIHWFGFYDGPHFYWTRFYGDRWWWYDPAFERWVYWNDGYWWWQAPSGIVYVYVDNNYYPYQPDQGTVVVKQPQTDQPPPAAPASPDTGSTFASPDGTRTVQIFGPRHEAFLYEAASPGAEPTFLRYLAKDVKDARFSRGRNGRTSAIMLDFNDGSFALYDLRGEPIDGATPR